MTVERALGFSFCNLENFYRLVSVTKPEEYYRSLQRSLVN